MSESVLQNMWMNMGLTNKKSHVNDIYTTALLCLQRLFSKVDGILRDYMRQPALARVHGIECASR